jgi:hypothetical protein
MDWKIIEIKPEWKEICKGFAEKVNLTTNYKDSNQPRSPRVLKNHFDGKMAEFAVSEAYGTELPDVKIYKGKQKSWEADLNAGQEQYAVKSQTLDSFQRYSPSMTFQCGSRRVDKVLSEPDAPVIYCLLLEDRALVSAIFRIKELAFGPPKLEKLAGEKTVAYLEKSHPELIKQAREIINAR